MNMTDKNLIFTEQFVAKETFTQLYDNEGNVCFEQQQKPDL